MKILEIQGWNDYDAVIFHDEIIKEGINLSEKFGDLEVGQYILWRDGFDTVTRIDEKIEQDWKSNIEFKVYEKDISQEGFEFARKMLNDGTHKQIYNITKEEVMGEIKMNNQELAETVSELENHMIDIVVKMIRRECDEKGISRKDIDECIIEDFLCEYEGSFYIIESENAMSDIIYIIKNCEENSERHEVANAISHILEKHI